MVKHDTARLKAAVQYLVDTSYFKHHVRKLKNVVERPRALPFRDAAEVLNELIVIGRQNREAMENLIALAEYKRDTHNDYQRKFMAQKRKRERRVLDIEQTVLGKTYTVEESREALLRQYDKWNEEKTTHIEQCSQSYRLQFGREPTWEQRNQFIREFWMLKDMELDILEEKAQEIKNRSAKKRVVVTPVQRPVFNAALQQKLTAVLDRKPLRRTKTVDSE